MAMAGLLASNFEREISILEVGEPRESVRLAATAPAILLNGALFDAGLAANSHVGNE